MSIHLQNRQFKDALRRVTYIETQYIDERYNSCMKKVGNKEVKEVLDTLPAIWESWWSYPFQIRDSASKFLEAAQNNSSGVLWGFFDSWSSPQQQKSSTLTCGNCGLQLRSVRELYYPQEKQQLANSKCLYKDHAVFRDGRIHIAYYCPQMCMEEVVQSPEINPKWNSSPHGKVRQRQMGGNSSYRFHQGGNGHQYATRRKYYWTCCDECYTSNSVTYNDKWDLYDIITKCKTSHHRLRELLTVIVIELQKQIQVILASQVQATSLEDIGSQLDVLFSFVKPFVRGKGSIDSTLLNTAFLLVNSHHQAMLSEPHMIEAFSHVCEIVCSHRQRFKDSLNSNDFPSIYSSLNYAKEHNSIVNMTQSLVQCEYSTVRVAEELSMQKSRFSQNDEAKIYHYLNVMSRVLEHGTCYSDMCESILMKLDEFKSLVCISYISPKTQTVNAGDRDVFYTEIWNNFSSIQALARLTDHIPSTELTSRCESCLSHMKDQVRIFGDNVTRTLETIVIHRVEDKTAYFDFNINLDSIRSIRDQFKDPSFTALTEDILQRTETSFSAFIQDLRKEALLSTEMTFKASFLVRAKLLSTNVPCFQKRTDSLINSFLDEVLSKDVQGREHISQLSIILNNEEEVNGGISSSIIRDHKHFSRALSKIKNEETSKFTVYDVLGLRGDGTDNVPSVITSIDGDPLNSDVEAIQGHDINKQILLEAYNSYYESFQKTVWDAATTSNFQLDQLIRNVTDAVKTKSSMSYKDLIVKLLTNIFAYWSLRDGYDNPSASFSGPPTPEIMIEFLQSLKHPHAAQVISILRLLEVENPTMNATDPRRYANMLSRHLVQIGTGQGKSVTLGVISIVLSLLGCTVNCVCYSEYLSKRDEDAFKALFDGFNVSSFIKYGTFNKLCEDLVNENGSIRDLAQAMLCGTSVDRVKKAVDPRPKVLLIDEVDVFFSPDFYGNEYKAALLLKDPTISALVRYAWRSIKEPPKLKYKNFILSREYLACRERFRDWADLVDNMVRIMLVELRNFINPKTIHNYIKLPHGKIGYKVLDGYSDKVFYGFSTIFAYLKVKAENDPKCSISDTTLEHIISFPISCGSFSYAEIPKRYECIMGVSGTLKQLGDNQLRILKETYGISKYTFMPSTYGRSKRQIHKTLLAPSKPEHAQMICDNINMGLKSTRPGADEKAYDRAVIVFFESMEELEDFRNLPFVDTAINLAHVHYLTESSPADPNGKQAVINNASDKGAITLMTRVFGRGTDFACLKRVKEAGGVHIIQTFLSEDVAEEVQIRGRSARESSSGSFVKILEKGSLERFGLSNVDVENLSRSTDAVAIDKKINDDRKSFYDKNCLGHLSNIVKMNEVHKRTQSFLGNLLNNNIRECKAFLMQEEENTPPPLDEGKETSRTLVLMDATGSMSHCIEATKASVSIMFKRISQVVEEREKQMGSVKQVWLQVAVYRNYSNTADTILVHSAWASAPAQLKSFMEGIRPDGGQGREAVELGLAHAVLLHDSLQAGEEKERLDQIALLGDAAPNTDSDVASKRAGRGESYWAGTKFARPTNFRLEMQKLIDRKIPVHCFCIGGNPSVDPGSDFREMALRSIDDEGINGTCQALDVSDPTEAAENLMDVLLAAILRDAGGEEAVLCYQELKRKGAFVA